MKDKKNKINWNSTRVFDLLMEIIILVVVFALPTIFDRRLGIVFSGTKAAWMRVFGSVILAVWAIKLLVARKHHFVRTPLNWPVISFLLCTTIATLTSIHVYTSVVGFYGRYEGLTSWFLFGLFFFVVINYIKTFEQLKRIIIAVASASTLMAVYSIIQRYEIDPYMWGGVVTWQRVIGTIGQPNFLAAYMLMAFFMILALFLLKTKDISPKIDWYEQLFPAGYFLFAQIIFVLMIYNLDAYNVLLWYFGFAIITASAVLFSFTYNNLHPQVLNAILGICLILNYICILYTQSRGGYMGLFTGMVVFSFIAGRRIIFGNWRKIFILGALILLISGITMTRPQYSPFARFASEITTEKNGGQVLDGQKEKLELKGAAGSRGETWKSAFQIVADYPIFGIGPEVLKMVFPRYETELFRFREQFHVKQDRCHNETLDVAVTKGLVTFFVYLWLLFTLFYVGWKRSKAATVGHKITLAGLLAAAWAFLIQNQFSFGVVAITSLFWMIWAMVMVVGKEEVKEETRLLSWEDVPWLPVAVVLILSALLIYISFFSFRADIWFKSGKSKLQVYQISEAASDFEKSLNIFPFEGSTVSHLGIAYLNLSRTDPGKDYLNKAIKTLEYGTQIDPYNADNFYMLSKIYMLMVEGGDQKALPKAKEYAETALKIDPYYAEEYFILGAIFEKEKDFDKAALNYEKAFFVNPNLVEAMQRLENLYIKMGKGDQVLKVFDKALKRYGNYLPVLEETGKLYLKYNKFKEVLDISNKIIKITPEASSGYLLRAGAYLRLNDTEKAFLDLQQVIINDPKNIQAHGELARYYLLKGDRQRAKQEFEQILLLDPGNKVAKDMLSKLK
jgi:tetratricopeptide (TPR) repeat protein/O-antigen ligase